MSLTREMKAALNNVAARQAAKIFNEGRAEVDTSDYDKGVNNMRRMFGVSKRKARAMMDYSIKQTNTLLKKAWAEKPVDA